MSEIFLHPGVRIRSNLIDYSSGIGYLDPEVYDWLIANVGPGSFTGGVGTNPAWWWGMTMDWENDWKKNYPVVYFDNPDPQTVMLFKLTWGGV